MSGVYGVGAGHVVVVWCGVFDAFSVGDVTSLCVLSVEVSYLKLLSSSIHYNHLHCHISRRIALL